MKKWNLNIDMMCYIVLMLKSMLFVFIVDICSFILSIVMCESFKKYFIRITKE